MQDLDSVGVGQNVTEGIAEGMTAAGWDTSAETLAINLETAINSALIINSPSERMKPAGEYVAGRRRRRHGRLRLFNGCSNPGDQSGKRHFCCFDR